MTRRFDFAAGLFRGAETAEQKRLACRVWLTDAIQWAQMAGEDVAPAMALLGALEGLDFGHTDPMLRLPEGQKVGGKEPPPGELDLQAFALAASDRLRELGFRDALEIVADELGMSAGALTSKRKHVMAERSKPEAQRRRYRSLITDYECECARLAGETAEQVLIGLIKVAKLLGRK